MALELIKDTAGDTQYRGKAEKCVYTFSTIPEQIPGESWLASQIVQKQIEELAKENSRLLHIRIWRDTSPTWQTDYKVEVFASASPLWWNAIILGVLAILALIITWRIVEIVKDIDWGTIPTPIQWAIPLVAIGLIVLLLVGRKR